MTSSEAVAEILGSYRALLDELDTQITELIAQRLAVCVEVGHIKRAEGIPMMQPDRVAQVRETWATRGIHLGVDPGLMHEIAGHLIDEACRLEDEIIGNAD